MPVYAWWRSPHDNQVHAFDLTASVGKPYLEAICTHTVLRTEVIENATGQMHMACLIAVGEQIPEDQFKNTEVG